MTDCALVARPFWQGAVAKLGEVLSCRRLTGVSTMA